MTLRTRSNPIFERRAEDAQQEVTARTILRRKTAKRELASALQSRNAVADIGQLPGAEESLHVICRGNFPLWQIVPAVLELAAPAVIDSLSIATLGFSTSNVADLLAMFDAGQVRKVSIVASVYFQRQNPKEYQQMAEGLESRGQHMAALRSHAKIITFAMSDGRRFVVESSANLRSCRNIEQITLTNSPALHDFHAQWIGDAITAGTKGKADAR